MAARPGRPWPRGTQPSRGAPHGSRGVGWGGVWGSAPRRVPGRQNPGPVQGHSMRLPQAGQLWRGGAGVARWGEGGQLCPAHVTRRPMALAWVHGWEQLASGRPPNKEPLSSMHACSAPSGQLTFPGMPRPAPSVAYRVPRGVGTAGPGARRPGSVLGTPAPPWGHLARARRPAPLPETSPCSPAPLALTGGVAWPPSPPLLQAPPSVW